MSDLYSIVPGLQPTPEQVREAETLATQFLQDNFPNMDLRTGTGVRDLVVRPTATLIAMLNLALTQYFSQNTLANVTDATPTDVVDSIMSNWFIPRKTGENAIINARLYFAEAKSVTIASNTYFSPDNTLKYSPAATLVFKASDLTFDTGSGEYYVDVNLTSESQDVAYNIESGSLLYFSTFDTYFLRAEINYLVQPSSPAESNTAYVTRAEGAISTRNLINIPSIISNIGSNFPTLTEIVPIGMGDPEMQRDRVKVENPNNPGTMVDFHIGGNVDVYCKTPLQTFVSQYTTDVNGDLVLTGPIYSISVSPVSAGAAADTIPNGTSYTTIYTGYSSPGNIVDYSQDVGFSSRQTITLSFGAQFANSTISLITKSFQTISSIQSYLEGSSNRVLSGSLLARGNNIYLLDFTVVSYAGVAPASSTVSNAIKGYLDSLVTGQSFIMSDLSAALYAAGITHIKTPITVGYTLYKRDYTVTTGSITDYLDPADRTASFRYNSLTISAQSI